MKKITTITTLAGLILVVLCVLAPSAQEDAVDRVTVQLTDPNAPVTLEVGLVNGGITVTGYDGDEVVVEARTALKRIYEPDRSSKAGGMKRIPVNSSSLTVEEYNNKIEIGTESWRRATDLVITIPKRARLVLSCVNDGDIKVENIIGDIEVSNVNGSVTLLNISGSAIASAHNEDVTVTFVDIDPDKDMSFSSFNGDVDVTFPASLKATVKIKTVQGDIYTDFDIEQSKDRDRVVKKNQRDSDGKYQVTIDRAFWGTINGGGQEMQFSNYNGDILIRKQR